MHKVLLMIVLLLLPLAQVSADEATDLLLYSVNAVNGKPEALALYNPANNTTTPLSSKFSNAILSADGRLAHSIRFEGKIEVHIWDSKHPDELSFSVLDEADADQYPLAWSPDGQKLAFTSKKYADPEQLLLYLWDGATLLNLTPAFLTGKISRYEAKWSPDGAYLAYIMTDYGQHPLLYIWDGAVASEIVISDMNDAEKIYNYDLTWSVNDLLAFTVHYHDNLFSEIYVWDGHNTMNLSQNPSGSDVKPAWSADGQIAFQSERDGVQRILVWDGVSIKDGLPDTNTFTTVASEITLHIFTLPTWTSTGQVAFVGQSGEDANAQIYVWDGDQATNISQNPTQLNANPIWNRDGSWAFTSYNSSHEEYLVVRGADNQLLLMTHAGNQHAWSSSGVLTFCRSGQDEWILDVWDGQSVHEITRGPDIRAAWQSGGSILCTSG